MTTQQLEKLVQDIVNYANDLKNKHTAEKNAPVNYVCIFSQNDEEYQDLYMATSQIGKVVKKTISGHLFEIKPIDTVRGNLKLLKIRKPDLTRPERGDADFTVSNYQDFKGKYLSKPEFKLIPRNGFEMIELMDPNFHVRTYFSHPPLLEQLDIK